MKYGNLEQFLSQKARSGRSEIIMSFDAIEKLIEDNLPRSASEYKAWWAFGDLTHPQSRAWTSAGYEPHPDLDAGEVRFTLKTDLD